MLVSQMFPKSGLNKEVQAFYGDRREAGKRINPHACEIICERGMAIDVYGIEAVPQEIDSFGYKNLFVRSSNEDGWVYVGDLPEWMREIVMARHDQDYRDHLAATA